MRNGSVEALEMFESEDFEDIVDDPTGEVENLAEGEDEDFTISGNFDVSMEDTKFDEAIGALQDIIISDEFQDNLNEFCRAHCDVFDDCEENKVEYMPLFKKHSELIEKFLEERLSSTVEGFEMASFLEEIVERRDEVNDEISDVLLSVAEFGSFKQQMLEFKRATANADIGALAVGGKAAQIHYDEQSDGELRPDLNIVGDQVTTPTKGVANMMANIALTMDA